jgi:hypothetical protein
LFAISHQSITPRMGTHRAGAGTITEYPASLVSTEPNGMDDKVNCGIGPWSNINARYGHRPMKASFFELRRMFPE